MDDLTRAALEKAAVNKAVKGGTKLIDAGTHEVDVTIRIFGTVTKGEEYSQTIRPAIPVFDVLVAMLDEAGCVQRSTFERAYARVAGGFEIDSDGIKAWAKEALSKLADLGERTCAGKTTSSLSIEAVLPEAVAVESEQEPVEA